MRANDAPLEIGNLPVDDRGPGEVRRKTAASGSLPMPTPCILGDEPAGIVERGGAGVRKFAPGEDVIGCLTARWVGGAASPLAFDRTSGS
jgi:Zn-dependent alcohol dehydrogenase